MNYPKVYHGQVVCITTSHNETQDDLHFGLVSKVPLSYKEDGKIEVVYMLKRWIEARGVFKYKDDFTGWDTWRLTEECVEINKRVRMFTHSAPPKDWPSGDY